MLVYSTLTSSLVLLENDLYTTYFENASFEDESLCRQLEEMGFLADAQQPSQLSQLLDIRKSVVETDGITSITIAPTMECNARCYYCFERGARRGTMSLETADALVDFLDKNCLSRELYIAWFGGEPLLATDVIDHIVDGLLDRDIYVESTITTNGILTNEKLLQKFKKWNVSRVQISLDGIGDAYGRIKRFENIEGDPFELIVGIISMLLDSGMSVHIRLNYKSTDESEVKEAFDYFHRRYGSHENLYLYGAPLDLPEIKGYSEFDREEGDIFHNVLRMSLDHGYENDELNYRDGVNISEDYNVALGELMLSPFPASCLMADRWRFVVDDQGILYKCQKHLGKPKYSCGDVFGGLKENAYFKYYATSELHDESCADCPIFPICQGGCNANRLLYGDKFACPPSKTIMKKLVMDYYRLLSDDHRDGEDMAIEMPLEGGQNEDYL
ncbi:radical SAM protein [Olsenella sp. KGMB02461]|nr:radical SAM protein [Olsenella sp. KGMB02461]